MNRPELITRIAQEQNCTKREARQAVEYVTAGLESALLDGISVTISGFGTFKVLHMPEHNYRHPVTGKLETKEAHQSIRFIPSRRIAEQVERKP